MMINIVLQCRVT